MELKYGNRVRVINGFYKGLTGIVSDWMNEPTRYYVEMTSTVRNQFTNPSAWILEEDLEKINEGEE